MSMWPSQWIAIKVIAKKPEKKDFGASTGFEPMASALALRNYLNCDSLRWSHTHFICIPAVHIISFCISFLSRVDELNKLASLQYMGRVWTLFFGLFRNYLNCDSLRWSHTHFICIPAVHIISFCVSFLSRVDELNKLASLQYMGRVWTLFFGLFRNYLNCDSLRWSHTHFICIPAVHIISFWVFHGLSKTTLTALAVLNGHTLRSRPRILGGKGLSIIV